MWKCLAKVCSSLGYFRKRMQNQMNNIREGYHMAIEYSEKNNFELNKQLSALNKTLKYFGQ